MKFHRHAQYLVHENMKKDAPRGYLFCDLCNCVPTAGSAGEREPEPTPKDTLDEAAPVDPKLA